MHLTEVLGVAHRSTVERQNVSGGAPLTYEVYLADGAHPGLYRPVYRLLVRNVALWIHKGLGAARKWAVLHFKEQTSNFVAGARARTIDMSEATFLPYQLPTT